MSAAEQEKKPDSPGAAAARFGLKRSMEMDPWKPEVKLRELEERVQLLEDLRAEDTLKFQQHLVRVQDNTDALKEFIELGKQLKVGLTLLGYLKSVADWVIKIGSAGVVVWAVWTYAIKEALRK